MTEAEPRSGRSGAANATTDFAAPGPFNGSTIYYFRIRAAAYSSSYSAYSAAVSVNTPRSSGSALERDGHGHGRRSPSPWPGRTRPAKPATESNGVSDGTTG